LSVVDPFTAAEYRGRGVEVRPLRPAVTYDIAIIWGAGRFRSAIALDFAETVRAAALAFAGSVAG
jgi:hypothetical protein